MPCSLLVHCILDIARCNILHSHHSVSIELHGLTGGTPCTPDMLGLILSEMGNCMQALSACMIDRAEAGNCDNAFIKSMPSMHHLKRHASASQAAGMTLVGKYFLQTYLGADDKGHARQHVFGRDMIVRRSVTSQHTGKPDTADTQLQQQQYIVQDLTKCNIKAVVALSSEYFTTHEGCCQASYWAIPHSRGCPKDA